MPGRHEGRSARIAGARPDVRRLPVRARIRDPSRARDLRHHRHGRPPSASAVPTGRRSRTRMRASCGDGYPTGRHRVRRRDLQPLHGLVGHAGRRGTVALQVISLRRRRSGNDARGRPCGSRTSSRRPSTARRPSPCISPRWRAPEGYEPRDFGLKVMFFSGEPGASVPGVRDKIRETYNARVIDCGSMAEMTPFMNVAGSEQSDQGMLCWQDVVYTEVCDPKTFRRVPYGERGTPVYTHLERTSQPMIRLLSGDLTLWENEAESLRAHLSAAAQRHLRPHRRHDHDPRRERLSERDRRGASTSSPITAASIASSSRARARWTSCWCA